MPYSFNPFTGNFDDVGSGGGSTSPGGGNTQLQYNNNGVFAGISTMTFDGTSVTLAGRLINSYTSVASSPAKVFTGTWFTGGTATTTKPHFLIEPTGTSSGAWSPNGTGLGVNAASTFSGNLLDLQVNGTSFTNITSAGDLVARRVFGFSTAHSPAAGQVFGFGISTDNGLYGVVSSGQLGTLVGTKYYLGNKNNAFEVSTSVSIGWSTTPGSGHSGGTLSGDLYIARDAANTLAQRNGTNAQAYRVYNTYTDASNYERGFLRWSSNVFEVGPEAAGTGTARPMRITAATLKLPNLPTYADNAAATTGGLVAGDVYKTATGELRITV